MIKVLTDDFQNLIEQQVLEYRCRCDDVEYGKVEFEDYDSQDYVNFKEELQNKIDDIIAKIEKLTDELNEKKAVTSALKVLANEIIQRKEALMTSLYPPGSSSNGSTRDMKQFDAELSFFINDENTSEINHILNQEVEWEEDQSLLTYIQSEQQNQLLKQKKTEAARERQTRLDMVQRDIPVRTRLENLSTTEIACFGSDLAGYTELQHYYEQQKQQPKKTYHFGQEREFFNDFGDALSAKVMAYDAGEQSISTRRAKGSNINRWHSKSMIVAILQENLYRYYANHPLIPTEFILERHWPEGNYALTDAPQYRTSSVSKERYITSAELRMIYRLMHEINDPVVNEIMQKTTRFISIASDKQSPGFVITHVAPCPAPWDGENAEKWRKRLSSEPNRAGYYQNLSKDWMNNLMKYQYQLIELHHQKTSSPSVVLKGGFFDKIELKHVLESSEQEDDALTEEVKKDIYHASGGRRDLT